MEPDGPNIDALESALKKEVPKFFYLIPDFQNPAGATCSGAKRRQIVELANRSTTCCSSRMRRIGCCGIAGPRSRRCYSSRPIGRCI